MALENERCRLPVSFLHNTPSPKAKDECTSLGRQQPDFWKFSRPVGGRHTSISVVLIREQLETKPEEMHTDQYFREVMWAPQYTTRNPAWSVQSQRFGRHWLPDNRWPLPAVFVRHEMAAVGNPKLPSHGKWNAWFAKSCMQSFQVTQQKRSITHPWLDRQAYFRIHWSISLNWSLSFLCRNRSHKKNIFTKKYGHLHPTSSFGCTSKMTRSEQKFWQMAPICQTYSRRPTTSSRIKNVFNYWFYLYAFYKW